MRVDVHSAAQSTNSSRLGYIATGTDLNTGAVGQGRARGNAAIFSEADLDFFQNSAVRPNVVYGYYMLERMADPLGYLRESGPIALQQIDCHHVRAKCNGVVPNGLRFRSI